MTKFNFDREPMLEMFMFESNQMLEQLENIMLNVERDQKLSKENVDEIFRIMHTLKGSSSMMMYKNISDIAHLVEDIFFVIRSKEYGEIDFVQLCDIVLDVADYIGNQIQCIESDDELKPPDQNLLDRIDLMIIQMNGDEILLRETEDKTAKYYITSAKDNHAKDEKRFEITVSFQEGCQMENIRAFSILHTLKDMCWDIYHQPQDLVNDMTSCSYIIDHGFRMFITTTETELTIREAIDESIFVESYSVDEIEDYSERIDELVTNDLVDEPVTRTEPEAAESLETRRPQTQNQNMINVGLKKLDKLMDLVGEIVITESMVTQNPDLEGLQLENFNKSVRQLRKLTDELQDIVMDIRMVPVKGMFQRMRRIVRDMSKSLNKDVELVINGEDTEIDKSVLDALSDPIMHLIRNAMDHGIEEADSRKLSGKSLKGTVRLEAKNSGSDVIICIQDDGNGIDRDKVWQIAYEKGLVSADKDTMSDRELNGLILLPGFSTKEEVTEFSGRGVGMDVVKKNIEKVRGTVTIDSESGIGTLVEIKIPLTLAIIDGMEVAVGNSRYTIPTMSVKESFRPVEGDVLMDPAGNEIIMIRGQCYPIIRLHEFFRTQAKKTRFEEGIMVFVENEKEAFCLFADELLGEQQVVVKPLPSYIHKYVGNVNGIGGCTIMGNGDMSLILDVNGM